MIRGHVRKRGRKWAVGVDVDADPQTGKRRRKWHSGFRTRREAEDARIRILSATQRGGHVEPSKLTLGQFLADRWLPAREPSLRPSTFESYLATFAFTSPSQIDSVRLQGMAADQLNSFYADRLSSATSPTRPTRHRRRQRGPRRRGRGAQAKRACSSSTSTATA